MIPIVNTRSYELVRDRIAEILASELPNQATLHSDVNLNASVFIDRIVPLDGEEVPLINVVMGSGNWDSFTQVTQDGNYIYNVDIYVGSKGSATESGDVLSMHKLQKLAGVVQGILMHPTYNRLAFNAPFIEHREVNSVSLGVPNNTLDATNTTQCRLQLLVRVPENSLVNEPTSIEGYDTQVKLGLTDKGYIYSGDNIPIPDPICEVVAFVYNTDNTLLAQKTVTANDNTIQIPNIQFTDSDLEVSSVASGVDIVAKECTPFEDVVVTNSNNSYNDTIGSGETLVVPDSVITINGDGYSSLPATENLNIQALNEDGLEVGYVSGNIFEIENFNIFNQDASYFINVLYQEDGFTLPNVDNIDSTGNIVSTLAMIPFTCTPQVKDLFLSLNYKDTNDVIEVLGDVNNAGIYTTIASGLTYSTDGTTYVSIPNPLTIVNATQYYFKRDTPTVTETKTLIGTYV